MGTIGGIGATGTAAGAAGGAAASGACSGTGAAGAEGATGGWAATASEPLIPRPAAYPTITTTAPAKAAATAASRRSTVPEKPTAASLSRCWLMHGIAPLRPKSGVFWFRAPVDGCL